jgi:predicted alpha/beta-fold hydrolase
MSLPLFFDLPEFDGQLIRTISYTYYQGADIGECLATAAKIKEGDFNSWFDEWNQIAQNVEKVADLSREQGNVANAAEAYLRASNYYRAATFFLFGFPVDLRLIQAYEGHVKAFAKGICYFSPAPEEVLIPFEGTTLLGYFYKTPLNNGKAPTLIANTGYDGTQQENYFAIASAALKRGYHVLCFDGPGQGWALIKQQLYMRPNWETVIKPIVDFLFKRLDVDTSRIALYGPSWGGYLAPRAACFEHRLAALIANPGQYAPLQSLKGFVPNIEEVIQQNQTEALESIAQAMMRTPMMHAKIRNKLWVHGIKEPVDLIRAWKEYTLEGIAQQIQCPTLVMDGEDEPFSSGQATKLFDALQCPKDYILLTRAEGAGGHCGGYGIARTHQKIFDWLDRVLK